jgi:hypothetical protein
VRVAEGRNFPPREASRFINTMLCTVTHHSELLVLFITKRAKIMPPANRAVTAAIVLSKLHLDKGSPLAVVAASSEDEFAVPPAVRRRTTHRLTQEPTTSIPTSRMPSSSNPSTSEPSTSPPTLVSITETIFLEEDTAMSTFFESVTTESLPPPTKVPSPSPRLSEKQLPTDEPTPQDTSSFRLRLYWEKGYRWQNKRTELWYCTGMFCMGFIRAREVTPHVLT